MADKNQKSAQYRAFLPFVVVAIAVVLFGAAQTAGYLAISLATAAASTIVVIVRIQWFRSHRRIQLVCCLIASCILWFALVDKFETYYECTACHAVCLTTEYRVLGITFYATEKFGKQKGTGCSHEFSVLVRCRYWGLVLRTYQLEYTPGIQRIEEKREEKR